MMTLQNLKSRFHRFTNQHGNLSSRKQCGREGKLGSNHCALMTECLESMVAVRVTYAGIVDSPKGQVTMKELYQCMIHASTTGHRLAQDLIDICVVPAIDVER